MTLATCSLLAGTLGFTVVSTARRAAVAQAAVTMNPIKQRLLSTRTQRLLRALIDLVSPAPLSEVLDMLAFCLALARTYRDALLQRATGALNGDQRAGQARTSRVIAFALKAAPEQRDGVRVPGFQARWIGGSAHGRGPVTTAGWEPVGPDVVAAAA